MADPRILDRYAAIIRAGYDAAAGEPISDDMDAQGLQSMLETSSRLADQLEHSIIDAPWLRGPIQELVNAWLSQPGELDLRDLRASLDPMFGASRALMIARSETAGVYNASILAGLRSHGTELVQLITAEDACDICLGVADEGPIPIAEAEGEGTLHPNCSCTWGPADESSDEENLDEGEAA